MCAGQVNAMCRMRLAWQSCVKTGCTDARNEKQATKSKNPEWVHSGFVSAQAVAERVSAFFVSHTVSPNITNQRDDHI